jgi:predicted nuclease of restriction endonuclease-like (RecB) superfamily
MQLATLFLTIKLVAFVATFRRKNEEKRLFYAQKMASEQWSVFFATNYTN